MLNIRNFDALKNEGLRELLSQIRPMHLSRFPIDVEVGSNGASLKFMDSRFLNEHWNYGNYGRQTLPSLAFIWVDKQNDDGSQDYAVWSRKIMNDKFKSHDDRFHIKTSKDSRKILKLAKEVLKSYTEKDIASRVKATCEGKFVDWQQEAMRKPYDMIRKMSYTEMLDLVAIMKAMEVPPTTDLMQQLYDTGLSDYEEYLHRFKVGAERIHVFINPDNTVQVTNFKEGNTPQLFDAEESLPEDIRQQVAVLRMAEEDKYVGYVGVKLTDREFWIDVK